MVAEEIYQCCVLYCAIKSPLKYLFNYFNYVSRNMHTVQVNNSVRFGSEVPLETL